MRSLTLFIASLVMWTSGLAQELVTFEEISFSSDVEKNAFEKHFIERNTDYFRLFMASGSLTESAIARARADFYNQLASLNTDKFKSRKNEKKARAIHDAFSTAYLKKFDPNARFEDLFTSGAFSSLSAAMLFGLALHELQIPYAVREQPENVYVMAYPASEKVVMENPAISLGAFTVSHEMKVHFVKSLKDQKVISAQEYASSGVETLFDKYYFANHRDLTFLEMAGLQYTYEGFARSAEDKPKEALFEFEKAHMLYPSERTVYLLMSAGLSAFTAHEKRDQVHATLLAKVARYKTSGITDEMIVGEFYKVIQHLLFDSGQKDKLEAYYQVLDSLMVNESLKSELAFLYNYENGRYLYNQARYKEAQSFFERALARKPADQNSIGAFINILIQTKSTSDNLSRMSALEGHAKSYPTLLHNNIFNALLSHTYLMEMQLSFEAGKANEGEKYRSKFENFFAAHPDLQVGEYEMGQAYSSAAVYYFRKGQSSKARSVVESGLRIAPENRALKMSKRMLD